LSGRPQAVGRDSALPRRDAAVSASAGRRLADLLPLGAILLAALGLRLLVWHWHELYPLGGDEREYFEQALTLLRERRYDELQLMRPPLYTGFLAACIYLLDSLVQRIRLVQAVISALTVLPVYALTFELFRERRAALVAALLAGLSYTLAANATELLSETLFLFGLATLLWLLLKARGPGVDATGSALRWAGLAGLALGALVLLRSVALPLLPLGALYLFDVRSAIDAWRRGIQPWRRTPGLIAALVFTCATVLVVGPWTARNYVTYGALILVDTTGPENLWLDNDPAGREAVKAQLYALGDDQAARQRLATERGVAVITADPARFLAKAWGEARKFFALQFFDDMRERRAIWVPPHEVWLRLTLGDGVWLLTLFGGVAGLWLAPGARARLLFVPWALYVLLTALLFHVELRYRLPLYPALLPFAGWALTRTLALRSAPAERPRASRARPLLAAATIIGIAGLMLLHRPYLAETWMLARKHAALWRADRALTDSNEVEARRAAERAIALDPETALGPLALARAEVSAGRLPAAREALDLALGAVPDHPRARVLRGAVLRALGEEEAARADLAYETASLEDLQRWAWDSLTPIAPAPESLDIGGGLDLGYLRGFHPAEQGGYRWTRAEATVRLATAPGAELELRLAAMRPEGEAGPNVRVLVNGVEVGRITPGAGWRTYRLALPGEAIAAGDAITVTIVSDTFRPRAFDRASGDNRDLGVAVDLARVVRP
jgi:4-amino-4-deoxy-L-arabinose transferase-like glycosyltransferase